MRKILLSLFALCTATSLWAVKFQSGVLYYNTLEGDSTVEVTYGSYQEGNYKDLINVYIPSTVTYNGKTYTVVAIGDYAFDLDPGDWGYIYNKSIKTVKIPKTVKRIGAFAFCYCSALTTINFAGDGLESIGSCAFRCTESLSDFYFPQTLKTIGDYAFHASAISGNVTIPDNVTSIGYLAFYYADKITSLTIGESCTTIGEKAFRYCSNLSSVTLGKSVKTIKDAAFVDCSKLTTVYLKSTTPPAFTNTNILPSSAKTFYVPCGAADTYFLSDWVTFTTNFIEEECIKKYTIYVNQDCTSSIEELNTINQ